MHAAVGKVPKLIACIIFPLSKGKSVEINGFEHFLRFLCEKVDGVMGKNFVKD